MPGHVIEADRDDGTRRPLVLLQHGAGGDRFSPYLQVARRWVEHGAAVATIDFPLHGERRSPKLSERLLQSIALGMDALVASVLNGKRFLEIIRDVLRAERDLVIKLAESADAGSRMLGSNDMHLLRKCPCPVWLLRPGVATRFRCVLAAVDVDERVSAKAGKVNQGLNRKILEMASSLALGDSAELHVVHVWDAIGESVMRGAFMPTPEEEIRAYVDAERIRHSRALDEVLDALKSTHGHDALDYLKPARHLPQGAARKEIPALVRQIQADVLVMGTVARTGIPGFFIGNTAETILNRIDCSVLAVKPEGFLTPVTLEG